MKWILTISTGMAISKPILEQTLEEYHKQMTVNGKRNPSLKSKSIANFLQLTVYFIAQSS